MLLGCTEGCHCKATSLVLVLAFLQVVASESNNYNCVVGLDSPGATIPRGDIILEEGKSLEVFCNLNISHLKAQGRNASSLVFYRNNKKVLPEFVEVLNATTIRLFVENPPPSTDMYYCKLELPNNDIGICLNMVAIGFKPQEVKDFSCISHNWQNLTCRWIKPENPIKTTYKLHFYLPGRAGKRLLFNCPEDDKKSSSLKRNLQKNEEMCFWDLYTDPHYRQPYEYYYFEMKGTNPLGDVKFEPIKFHHYSHVIPSPPEKLTLVNTTTSSAFLSWDVPFPMQIFPPGVHHRMVYQSTYDSERWHVANTSYLPDHRANQTYNLTDLSYANTLYDVRVYLRSAFAVGDDKWSHHASITFKTQSTVPGAPPQTVIGSFEVIPEGVTRDVYVYWRQIPSFLHNGDKFDYKVISVKENGVEKLLPYNHTPAYARFKCLTYNTYEFSIVSVNNVGSSVTKSVVHVPSKEDMPKEPVSFTKIAFHDGIYELSWKAPSESPNIDSYSIFWCLNGRDRPYQCTGLLNWTVVPANVTLKNITVPDDTKIYQFAISANTKNASSGMVWASCTVIHNKVVDKMKSVWINRIGSSFIEVGWKLECSDRIGRVEAFEIGFCPIVSPRETACKEPKQSMKLEPSERQFHGNVTGLRPYTTYMVTIAILTNNGKGTPSDPLFNTTMEAAPDPPSNVSVTDVTNSSVTVHWSPPASMNGVLRFYKVFFNNSERRVDSKNCTTYILYDLASFTTYKISVVACTVDCSEPSTPIAIRTKIGNPGKVDRPRPRFLNDSQVLVQWPTPKDEDKGGKLDYYEVRLQQSDGTTNKTMHSYTSTENVSQIPIPDCSKDESRVKYTFWVRAVNIGERNQSYFGPWSDPGETTCYSSGPTLAVKITIYVVCFLLVTALCIAVACVGKRVWKWITEMRQVEVKLPPGLAPAGDKEKDQDFPIDVTWTTGDHDHHLTGKVRPSADEELLLKKKEKKEERHGRNPSGDSSGCSSGHESVSSSLTSGTQISSDSGTEVDQRPPSPDGVFDESTPWDRASLRLRKASSSVARSTPNLSDVEGLSSGHCVGAWSSTGYISMPSSEEVGSGSGEGTSYCRVGLDASPIGPTGVSPISPVQLPQPTLPVVKGYVVLPSGPPTTSSTGALSPQMQHPSPTSAPVLGSGSQSASRGYVSHQLSWASPKESPNKGYVMAGELGDMAANKTSPSSLMVMGIADDQNILDVDVLEGDAQTPESYCRLGFCTVPPIDVNPEGDGNLMKPSSGYVTLGEGSHSSDMMSAGRESTSAQGVRVAGTSGYVPHRHFEKRNTIPLSSACNEQTDDSYTQMIPTSSGETKSPTTNV